MQHQLSEKDEKLNLLEHELQLKQEQERIQNEVFSALSGTFDAIFRINLEEDSYIELSCAERIRHYYNGDPSATQMLQNVCEKIVDEKNYKRMQLFFDLRTLAQRLAERDFLETECITKEGNWHRARFLVKHRDENSKVTHVLYVTRIIDDEKQYEEHLIARAEYADYANRMKSEFISQVAHDIRTPMNSILGFLEIAENNLGNWDKVEYSLEKIRTAGEFLKKLIDDVLDISSMESGKMKIQPAVMNLTQMLENLIEALRNTSVKKEQTIQVNIHQIRQNYIVADSLRLQQIYDNVLSNAVKYTPDGGSISFTVYEEELTACDRVRLIAEIADNGIGMSEEFMEKMFAKFEREMDTRINRVSGYGLGLAIVKQLVDLMGGTIQVQSKQGVGTTFRIELEVPYVEGEFAEEAQEEIDYVARCSGMHLLVAEDNELNREVVTELLAMRDITCDCVEDGALCLKQLQNVPEGTYDAVLMDMQMPNLNGVEATRQIRALPYTWAKTLPIFAMTANALSGDVQKCLNAGMNQHLSKPLDMDALLRFLAVTRK